MRYPKISLEANLGLGARRGWGKGVLSLGGNGGGKSLVGFNIIFGMAKNSVKS